jgi:putative transposase
LHTASAREINQLDGTTGRKVWFQYWDTCLTIEKSYLARLNYVHNNAVHHKLVSVAEQYEFCSARWFAANADPTFRRKVATFRYNRLNVPDDF